MAVDQQELPDNQNKEHGWAGDSRGLDERIEREIKKKREQLSGGSLIARGPLLLFWYFFFAPVAVYETWTRDDVDGGMFWFLFLLALVISCVQVAVAGGLLICFSIDALPPWTGSVLLSTASILAGIVLLLGVTMYYVEQETYRWVVGTAVVAYGFAGMLYVAEPENFVKGTAFRVGAYLGVQENDMSMQYRYSSSYLVKDPLRISAPSPFTDDYISLDQSAFRVGIPDGTERPGEKQFVLTDAAPLEGARITVTLREDFPVYSHFDNVRKRISASNRSQINQILNKFNSLTEYELAERMFDTSYDDVRKTTNFKTLFRTEILILFKTLGYQPNIRPFRAPSLNGFFISHTPGTTNRVWVFSTDGEFIVEMRGESSLSMTADEWRDLFSKLIISVKHSGEER